MTTNILLAGVGGQGILSIAAVLDTAALNNGFFFKQSEVHGMSQRGGAVQSHVRIAPNEVYSDLIPRGQADILIAMEPMEGLRYISYLKKDGHLITDSNPYNNIADYPEMEVVLNALKKIPHHTIIDAVKLARLSGNVRAANMVLLGVATELLPLKERAIIAAIKKLFSSKGQRIVDINLKAFNAGKNHKSLQYD